MNRHTLCLSTALLAIASSVFSEEKKPVSASKTVASDSAPKEAKKAPPAFPDADVVLAAMKKGASAMRAISFGGGYAWKWPRDLSIAKGENHSSPSTIMIQPPGTPAVGMSMLAAFRATGDKIFLQGAREAAAALIWCQLATGGWDSDYDFHPGRSSRWHFRRDLEGGDIERRGRNASSTLDDNKTQSALLFLLELSHTAECADDVPLKAAVRFGIDALLAAQAPIGAWGQHYTGPADATAPVKKAAMPAKWSRVWPDIDYTSFYTLNDNNLFSLLLLLIRAHDLEKDEKYLAAARKLGDFLLLAQLPEPQPGWAQQYNHEMEPVWARKFEPPAVSGHESFGALRTLHELWAATGDEKYLAPMKSALAWLERSKLSDGCIARFYEMGTNKPLFCKRETYELTYDDSDLPTHYGFKSDDEFQEDLDQFKEQLAMTREEITAKRANPTDEKKWASRAKSLAPKVTTALTTQDKKGYWLKDDMIDAGEFVKSLKAMSSYVESAKKGGAAFKALRPQAK